MVGPGPDRLAVGKDAIRSILVQAKEGGRQRFACIRDHRFAKRTGAMLGVIVEDYIDPNGVPYFEAYVANTETGA